MELHAIHTACGIETVKVVPCPFHYHHCMQSIPLAVLKLEVDFVGRSVLQKLHAIHTACGIETTHGGTLWSTTIHCMQSIPLAVLKHVSYYDVLSDGELHAIHTACGIETELIPRGAELLRHIACNPYRLRY